MGEGDEMIDHLSPSQIGMYLRCGKQYEYRYMKGIIIPPTGVMVLGSAYHDGVADRFRYVIDHKEQPDPQLALDTFDSSFERIKTNRTIKEEEDFFEFDEVEWEEDAGMLKDTGIALLKDYEQGIARVTIPMTVETKEFLAIQPDPEEAPIPIHLVTDLTTPVNTIDHKVKSKKFSESELAQNLQATIYPMATGKPLIFHVAKKTKTPIVEIQPAPRVETDVIWFVRQADRVWKAIHAGIFVPNNQGWWCSPDWCGYWRLCQGG